MSGRPRPWPSCGSSAPEPLPGWSAAAPKAASPPTMAWNRVSTLGWASSPANAGVTRVSTLYLARIPAGLAIVIPLVALAFTMTCLVTAYEGTPNPTTVAVYGLNVPENLGQAGLQGWLLDHPQQAANGLPVPSTATPAEV